MQVMHQHSLMVASEVQKFKDTVLEKNSDHQLIEFMADLSKVKTMVTLPGGNSGVIPQVEGLLDKYGAFFFDKDRHLKVSTF